MGKTKLWPLLVSRPHRQAVATLAVLAFTVAPTVYVACTAWRIQRPGHARDVERALGQQIGLALSLKDLRHLRPGEDVLHGVVIGRDEARTADSKQMPLHELARADVIHIRKGRAGQLTMTAEGLVLRGESPRQAVALATTLLQRAGGTNLRQVSLSARDCVLELGESGAKESLRFALRDVVGAFQTDAHGPVLTASYRVPGEGTTTRCELTLRTAREAGQPLTTLAFKTMEGLPLPARVLDPFFRTPEWLGPQARVEGTLALTERGSADWEAEFSGTLFDIDLGVLVGRQFPDHRLSGLARVAVRKARWADRHGAQGYGWVEAEGELASGPGQVGLALLTALRTEMQFRLPPQLEPLEKRTGTLAFQRLGMGFSLAPDGEIRLAGALGNEFPPGAVLVDGRHGWTLASAPEGAANVRGLIRTLFPTPNADPSLLVPTTAESQVLRYLPVPAATASKTRDVMSN